MIDLGAVLWLVAGFGFLLLLGALLGADTDPLLTGPFAQQAAREWPRGVQETDVPRFAVEHLDALHPLAPGNRLPKVTAIPQARAN